ncbi:pyridoxal phosphate-dependent decarboxylase family protein [Pseudemcibacter aquimaris]|uniref:pyridoxal phosphate-dependent decarboxylase family protein n=1 Tax=Pseudemcibacter aquimaris TaxID=2857064 RepID=UPI0020113F63|nr:aminotransferase class V-fold PLP-dependent enzyme [Pseudemcibacter aquimaris]MCC3860239.1 aminotransferase class V-fold PLP-dependent enzyme [Pseudemcibacter aquimaris]WDU57564.1 aminotransferase class V-fold PLP-dependent enzyme [Pseudemcibacter aquimaris]
MKFDLDQNTRKEILIAVTEKLEDYYANTKACKITPTIDVANIKNLVSQVDLINGMDNFEAIDYVTKNLKENSVHTPHPSYFGLYNPRSNYAGIIADLITAYFNPQLAAWSHAPFAVEVEAHLIAELASKFGYSTNKFDGVFATGGNEANQTAVLCALNNQYPNFNRDGIFSVSKKPIIYCSEEAHHSVHKAAKTAGLGYNSVIPIPVGNDQKLDTTILKEKIEVSTQSNHAPLMIIGTAGTTGAGIIDDLVEINNIAKEYNIWFHVDAAYGGAAALSEKLRNQLKGIELSNSITFDAHKWMSVPMGASVFITSHPNILAKTFSISTEYMPKDADKLEVVDPYCHSIQWSRRFIGLKLFLSLLFYGWKGYEETINHQADMADLLRNKLTNNGWVVLNKSNLPVVCFTDEKNKNDQNFTTQILENIYENGNSWLSVYPINNINCFRACITNYNTTESELDELIEELNIERDKYTK